MLLALILALLSGALCALLVCKAVELKLWLDAAAGIGGGVAFLLAAKLAGAQEWPLFGWPLGYLAVVVFLKLRAQA